MERWRSGRLVGATLVASAVLLNVGCQVGPTTRPYASYIPTDTSYSPGGGGVSGTLRLIDGCIRFVNETEEFDLVPVFPTTFTAWDPDTGVIAVDHFVHDIGVRTRLYGDKASAIHESWRIPEACPRETSYFVVTLFG